MQVSTHATLLARLQVEGDARAWSEFVSRYGVLVRAVARRHGLQAADADDVLQDVLVGLSRAMPRFEYDPARARFRTFLQTIVQRIVFQTFRQKRAGQAISGMDGLPDAGTADDIWEAEWRQYHLRRAMQTIEVEFSGRDRRVFTMYAGSQRSGEDVAELLGLSVEQVYQIKSRIMTRLSELVALQVSEEG